MRVITFKIDEDLLTLLDRYAINRGLYRSEVIREAIIEFLSVRGYKVNG
jgi:metal-responsive CopG/Arc/MetJ family transcriptional regulator